MNNKISKINSRNTILDAAEYLFNKQGFHAVGIDLIRDISGISKVTLYKHFDGKRSLILEVLKRRNERFISSLEAQVDKQSTTSGRIRALLDWHVDWFKSENFTGCMFVSADKELGVYDADIKELSRIHKQSVYNIIKSSFASSEDSIAGKDGEILCKTGIIFLCIEGAITEAAVTGELKAFSDVYNYLISLANSSVSY